MTFTPPAALNETDAPWWQRAVGYQIYPRSFMDSDGDGIGDIPGIISRLDHLADLGIGFVWLSPVYASPQRDMGYDISDYRDIAPEYGTMEDMERLIAEARDRGIGIVMDLVVNHTSDHHWWFRTALSDPASPESDYYVWRDPVEGGPPTDLQACFGGPAWNWSPGRGQYYLGFFSPHQPDLNWQNPALRHEIWDMMRWWFDKGIAGFRMDVISLIGKNVDAGVFEEGPDLHRFLNEMYRETLQGRQIVTIGESWSVSRETARLYCGHDRDELDMVFQFNHITALWDETYGKWKPKPYDLRILKRTLFDWQAALHDDGWNSLFLSNHDLPRQVSIYGDDGQHRVAAAKSIATVLHLMKGTPFVYQGEEIGMTNRTFTDISEFRDLETLNHQSAQVAAGVSGAEFLAGANRNARDHSRTPMQWSDADQGGFTTGEPWIGLNPNYPQINVAADRDEPHGILAHYRRLIALRRDDDLVCFGRTIPALVDHEAVFAYSREQNGERLSVCANLSGEPQTVTIPDTLAIAGQCLVATHTPRNALGGEITLAPWESLAIRST